MITNHRHKSYKVEQGDVYQWIENSANSARWVKVGRGHIHNQILQRAGLDAPDSEPHWDARNDRSDSR